MATGLAAAGANSTAMAVESRIERQLDKWIDRATTPRGAAVVIATVSTVMTVGAGLLMTLTDHDSFPTLGSGIWWGGLLMTVIDHDSFPRSEAASGGPSRR